METRAKKKLNQQTAESEEVEGEEVADGYQTAAGDETDGGVSDNHVGDDGATQNGSGGFDGASTSGLQSVARPKGSVNQRKGGTTTTPATANPVASRRDKAATISERHPTRTVEEERRRTQPRLQFGDSNTDSEDDDRRRPREPARRRELKVDVYAGDANVEAYLAQFRLAARRNGWPAEEWGDELALRLRGEARTLILPDAHSQPPSFAVIKQKLRARFATPANPALHVAQLRARRRKEKETVAELSLVRTNGTKGIRR